MHLSSEQLHCLLENGYTRLPGLVPPDRVAAALRAINHSLGEGLDSADLPRLRSQSYCPELTQSPAITTLYNQTPAREMAESLIGQGMIAPVSEAQIALRFPTLEEHPPEPSPHIDGMYTPDNGVPRGSILNFTALFGIFLSDVPTDNWGNFTVWPGTHLLHERYFRENGPRALLNGLPSIKLPEPLQLTARAGDAILAHYLLSHAVAPNTSPHIRYACFFRLSHADHDRQRWDSLTNAWLQWPSIKEKSGNHSGTARILPRRGPDYADERSD